MRKFLLLACLSILALTSVPAQVQQDTKEVYCLVVGYEKFLSNKVTITIDYGQYVGFFENSRSSMKIVDEDGNKIKFNSIVDACNYLASMGWSFVSAYPMVDGKQGTCYHYLFKKVIGADESIDFNTKKNTPKKRVDNSDGVYN